jgi:uncharacterized protein Yka (UPF0111/DUF47 family)
MPVMSQVEYLIQELKDNARMKQRQSEILLKEAMTLEECADRIRRALEVDAKRTSADPTTGGA